jgi:hypothetical protein
MTLLSAYQVASGSVQAVYAAVDHTTDWPINRTGVVIGEVAWDNCQCGQLVVTEVRRFPSSAFPLEQVDHTAECNEPWLVIQFLLSLTRCVAVSNESGDPPAIALLDASAQQNSKDMTAARKALMCYLSSQYDTNAIAGFEIGSQEVTGPGGSCAGFDMTFMVGYTNDCGC